MKLKKNKDIVIHNENGGYVLLNMTNGNFYGLYDLSLSIWEMLEETDDSDEIINKLINKYSDVEKEIISEDVNSFIKELINEEIIEEYE